MIDFRSVVITLSGTSDSGHKQATGVLIIDDEDYPTLLAELAEVMRRWDFQRMSKLTEC